MKDGDQHMKDNNMRVVVALQMSEGERRVLLPFCDHKPDEQAYSANCDRCVDYARALADAARAVGDGARLENDEARAVTGTRNRYGGAEILPGTTSAKSPKTIVPISPHASNPIHGSDCRDV